MVDTLDPVLAVALHIVARFAASAQEELLVRYDMGWLVHTLQEQGKLAENLPALTRIFGLDESRLRYYSRISQTFPPKEFYWVASLRRPDGRPLSWTHIEHLQKVTVARRRREIAFQAAQEAWAVKELEERVRALRVGSG